MNIIDLSIGELSFKINEAESAIQNLKYPGNVYWRIAGGVSLLLVRVGLLVHSQNKNFWRPP